jgi:hypothetical protein
MLNQVSLVYYLSIYPILPYPRHIAEVHFSRASKRVCTGQFSSRASKHARANLLPGKQAPLPKFSYRASKCARANFLPGKQDIFPNSPTGQASQLPQHFPSPAAYPPYKAPPLPGRFAVPRLACPVRGVGAPSARGIVEESEDQDQAQATLRGTEKKEGL